MLFHEVYGLYYQTVGKIIAQALEGNVDLQSLRAVVEANAFSESAMTIIPALQEQRWPLLTKGGTLIKNVPQRSLTLLERRWLKSISLDPRVKLFGDLEWEDNVEPLFRPEDFVVYDRYSDGDRFTSPGYVRCFRTILTALRERRCVQMTYIGQHGRRSSISCVPHRLEYSEKDDKFRLVCLGRGSGRVINLSRIVSCTLGEREEEALPDPVRSKRSCILELTDGRNALERVLLQFSDLEKVTERIDDDRYRMTIQYDAEDETEIVIRVLAFGRKLRAVGPERFVELIRARLRGQMECGRRL